MGTHGSLKNPLNEKSTWYGLSEALHIYNTPATTDPLWQPALRTCEKCTWHTYTVQLSQTWCMFVISSYDNLLHPVDVINPESSCAEVSFHSSLRCHYLMVNLTIRYVFCTNHCRSVELQINLALDQ